MRSLLVCLLCALRLAGQPASTIYQAGAAGLEKSLAAKPDDVAKRAALLDYYLAAEQRGGEVSEHVRARARHLRWFAEHAPESGIWESPAALLNAAENADAYEPVKAIWLSQARTKAASDEVRLNAARFLALADRDAARDLVETVLKRRAKQKNARYLLGLLDGMSILGVARIFPNGLADFQSAPQRLSPEAEAVFQALNRSEDARRVCGAVSALTQYGSMLFNQLNPGVDVLDITATLVRRGLRLDSHDAGCSEAERRVEVWTALKGTGWFEMVRKGNAPLLVDGRIANSWRKSSVTPRYPREARERRVQGVAVIVVIVDTEGNVVRASPVSGPPELGPASAASVALWKYRPLVHHGARVSFVTDVQVTFSVSQ